MIIEAATKPRRRSEGPTGNERVHPGRATATRRTAVPGRTAVLTSLLQTPPAKPEAWASPRKPVWWAIGMLRDAAVVGFLAWYFLR